MICTIMQPTYIPWLGYFDLIDSADRFILLDDAKLKKRSWQVRNRIKTQYGEEYLTIPVKKTKDGEEPMINEAVINYRELWQRRHLQSIRRAYSQSQFFDEVYVFLEGLLNHRTELLRGFTVNIIVSICKIIGLKKELILSSTLEGLTGAKDLRSVSICKKFGCEKYVSPQGSAVYIDRYSPGGEFPKHNISLFYQNYEHPVYPQQFGEFLPYMSAIDLFFNCGFGKSLEIIRSGRRQPIDYLSFSKSSLPKAEL